MTSSEKEIFTLKQVANSIQKTLTERYNRTYWVKAEMHKLNYTMKGHCYPELVYKENDIIVAEMRGQIWKTNFDRIMDTFSKVVKEPIQDGMLLLFEVKIVFHPVYGLSLEIIDIDPSFTLGELHKEREETIKKLEKEGIFTQNHQLSFPLLPKRIAIISVESSKGLSDFYSVTKANSWGYTFFFMLFQAQLNGDGAIQSILNQLKKIEKVKNHFDAVVIVRGGGGEIGLSCYNNYELTKAIALFPIPVLTGIGHSTNVTVAELVAYKSAITPTELGEFLIQCFHNFSVPIKDAIKVLKHRSASIFKSSKDNFLNQVKLFKQISKNQSLTENNKLREVTYILNSEIKNKLLIEKQSIIRNTELVKHYVNKSNQNHYAKLERSKYFLLDWSRIQKPALLNTIQVSQQQLTQITQHYFKTAQQKLIEKENIAIMLDPQNILKRGYVIPLYKGKLMNENQLPESGEEIEFITQSHKLITILKSKRLKDE